MISAPPSMHRRSSTGPKLAGSGRQHLDQSAELRLGKANAHRRSVNMKAPLGTQRHLAHRACRQHPGMSIVEDLGFLLCVTHRRSSSVRHDFGRRILLPTPHRRLRDHRRKMPELCRGERQRHAIQAEVQVAMRALIHLDGLLSGPGFRVAKAQRYDMVESSFLSVSVTRGSPVHGAGRGRTDTRPAPSPWPSVSGFPWRYMLTPFAKRPLAPTSRSRAIR